MKKMMETVMKILGDLSPVYVALDKNISCMTNSQCDEMKTIKIRMKTMVEMMKIMMKSSLKTVIEEWVASIMTGMKIMMQTMKRTIIKTMKIRIKTGFRP